MAIYRNEKQKIHITICPQNQYSKVTMVCVIYAQQLIHLLTIETKVSIGRLCQNYFCENAWGAVLRTTKDNSIIKSNPMKEFGYEEKAVQIRSQRPFRSSIWQVCVILGKSLVQAELVQSEPECHKKP